MDSADKLVWHSNEQSGFCVGKIVDLLSDKAVIESICRPMQTSVKFELINNNTKQQSNHSFDSIFPFDKLSLAKLLANNYKTTDSCLADVDDNCALVHLNEPSLLDNIRIRYLRNKIYTYVAHILIAVNPYVQLSDLHSERAVRDYTGKSLGAMPPHVFAVADNAYREMKALRKSQSIIISGESGAGKTESQKYVLKYLCVSATQSKQLEQLILNANPLLEAFGNAKTIRNNNSSRFGKFIELHYSANKFEVNGAKFVHYFLEKSRICIQSLGERNYHIFYQLCAALPDAIFDELSLEAPDKFRYLRFGNTQYFQSTSDSNIDTSSINKNNYVKKGISQNRLSAEQLKFNYLSDPLIDDVKCFEKTCAALESFSINEQLRNSIFKIVAAVLHLGNIEFVDVNDNGPPTASQFSAPTNNCGCTIAEHSIHALQTSARLLQLDVNLLREALTSRIMSTSRGGQSGTIYMVQLNVSQAQNARDALAKAIYARLFDYVVVQVVNKSLLALTTTTTTTTAAANNNKTNNDLFIGVLDVAGFEYFERNSFEQLLINFCNEKLQAFFNARVMRYEQETYDAEKLNVQRVEFADNAHHIELFEAKAVGLFHLLDDECKLPRPSAQNFTQTAHSKHSKQVTTLSNNSKGSSSSSSTNSSQQTNVAILKKPREMKLKLRDDEGFIVRHFAGTVCYETSAFIEKNNDALHHSLRALMLESGLELLTKLFDETTTTATTTAATATTSATNKATENINSQTQFSMQTHHSQQASKLNFISVSATFRNQLNELMLKLESTGSHFIKCVKPNSEMCALKFDGQSVLTQLRCSGMHSVLKLMQFGFPSRVSFSSLYDKYSSSLPPQLARLEPRMFCRALFKAIGLSDSDFKFGTTRVFFKAGKFAEFDAIVRVESKNQIEELVARAFKWLLAARWRRVAYCALCVVKLGLKLAERRLAIVRLQSSWRLALVSRRVKFRLEFLKSARLIVASLDEFERICNTNSAYKSMPERAMLEKEARNLRLQISDACNKLVDECRNATVCKQQQQQTQVASELRKSWQAKLDTLSTSRDLLVRTVRSKMEAQVEALERELAAQRALREAEEVEKAKAAALRLERQEFEARRCREFNNENNNNIKNSDTNNKDNYTSSNIKSVDCASNNPTTTTTLAAAIATTQSKVEATSTVIEQQKCKFDLSKWKYSELRDTINTSCDIQLLEACKREFHRRLKVYHEWKAANAALKRAANINEESARAPASVLQASQNNCNNNNNNINNMEQLPTTHLNAIADNEQRYFRIPFSKPTATTQQQACSNNEQLSNVNGNTGLWFAHFDGQWIARQLELHPNKQPILLIAGRDDMSMCELSLRETRLASRRGAEISAREFEAEWTKNGGSPFEQRNSKHKQQQSQLTTATTTTSSNSKVVA